MELLHDPAKLTAFVTFSAVFAVTPGPSNTLLVAIGTSVGVRRGLASLLGQVTGMGVMLFVVTFGLGNLLLAHPMALEVLEWVGAAMIFWIAWRVATAAHAERSTGVHAGFLGMAAFQWVNPKAWLVAVPAVATFLDRRAGGALGQAVVLATVFASTALPCCFPWLAFGAALERYLRRPRARRVVDVAMAVLLAGSVVLFVALRS